MCSLFLGISGNSWWKCTQYAHPQESVRQSLIILIVLLLKRSFFSRKIESLFHRGSFNLNISISVRYGKRSGYTDGLFNRLFDLHNVYRIEILKVVYYENGWANKNFVCKQMWVRKIIACSVRKYALYI